MFQPWVCRFAQLCAAFNKSGGTIPGQRNSQPLRLPFRVAGVISILTAQRDHEHHLSCLPSQIS
jgi:hypothetical protein